MTRVKLFRVSFCTFSLTFHFPTFHWFEEQRWPVCQTYSAEEAAATKAGSAGTAGLFNILKMKTRPRHCGEDGLNNCG